MQALEPPSLKKFCITVRLGSGVCIAFGSLLVMAMSSRGALKQLMRAAGQRGTALSPSSGIALRSNHDGLMSHPHGVFNVGLLVVEKPVRWANLKAISDRMRSVG